MANKQQAELHFIAKATFKSNGYSLYRIASGEKQYEVSVISGRVTGCKERNGDSCKGWSFQHKCRHAEYVSQLEAERSPVAAKVQEAASIRDAIGIGDRGHLNGGPKAFSVLAV